MARAGILRHGLYQSHTLHVQAAFDGLGSLGIPVERHGRLSGHGCRMICAGVLLLSVSGLENGKVSSFWLDCRFRLVGFASWRASSCHAPSENVLHISCCAQSHPAYFSNSSQASRPWKRMVRGPISSSVVQEFMEETHKVPEALPKIIASHADRHVGASKSRAEARLRARCPNIS